MSRTLSCTGVVAAAAIALSLSGCGGGGAPMSSMPEPAASSAPGSAGAAMSASHAQVDTDSLANDVDGPDAPSVLALLNKQTTIGSTVDPTIGDVNPYGLDISPVTRGRVHQGDLVVCDFNDRHNLQGTGDAIIALSPVPGSTPRHVTNFAPLGGCTENVQTSDGTIWVPAFVAHDVAEISPLSDVIDVLKGPPFTAPFGITIARDLDIFGNAVFYESDASTGDIVRIRVSKSGIHSEVIATGFPVNHGVPGTELGPSGLQYQALHDRLYIVDGANNAFYELRHVSSIPEGGIIVGGGGMTFSGPFAHRAKLVFSGSPLNAPISSALFSNGNVAIGNTGNPNGFNLMVEITPHGIVADVKNVDNTASGAIFGMVTGGTSADPILYFNDDNLNSVVELTRN